jgi:XRE family transcriptional regulator
VLKQKYQDKSRLIYSSGFCFIGGYMTKGRISITDNMEFGYTPNNLKAVRQKHGLTQKAAADLLDINISALQRWEADINLKSHADMPIKKWFELLSKL